MTDENQTGDDELQQKIKEADEQAEEKDKLEEENQSGNKEEKLTNALARAMADLQNYKRRTEEDHGKFVKFANAELLKQILPVIDNFDRSAEHLPDDLKENDWAKGIVQIHDELLKTLEKVGVKRINTVGEKLDPNIHEGLMTGPGEKDVIVEEFESGYTLNGDVIKVAKVKVGDGSEK